MAAAAPSLGPIFEDFEDDNLNFSFTGTWVRTDGTGLTTQPYSGSWCYASADITDGQSSDTEISMPANGTLSFMYSVSSESNYDKLRVEKNGTTQIGNLDGAIPWASYSMSVAAGDVIRFIYQKDGSVSDGDDKAFIDDVLFTPE